MAQGRVVIHPALGENIAGGYGGQPLDKGFVAELRLIGLEKQSHAGKESCFPVARFIPAAWESPAFVSGWSFS